MKYNFNVTQEFAKDFKQLLKKNKNLPEDFNQFLDNFNHTLGNIIQGTGGAFKIRMSRKGTGKRGGYRVIYYYLFENQIYFMKIYNKTIQENISDNEKQRIQQLINAIKENKS